MDISLLKQVVQSTIRLRLVRRSIMKPMLKLSTLSGTKINQIRYISHQSRRVPL